ncbi:MAG: hypothetical protein ACYC4R_01015 [Anaerolineae bacterium]
MKRPLAVAIVLISLTLLLPAATPVAADDIPSDAIRENGSFETGSFPP